MSLMKDAVMAYGEHSQMIKCSEECGELIRAISRLILFQGNNKISNFNEELADVETMLAQMKETSYFDDELFNGWKDRKLERLRERLDSNG